MEKISEVLTSVLLILMVLQATSSQNNNAQCEKRSCYPATGDLLVGRASQLYASSTCGMKEPEGYCIVSHLQHFNECFICDASEPSLSHLPENMISTFNGNEEKTWWQSENSKEEVYIQLDLEAQFHFTHLVMTFRTFRPAGMLIERSWNYGRNWTIYRYFASDCAQTFPGIPTGPQKDVDDIICTEDFSSVEPSSGGEVIFRALNPQIQVKDPYSEKVQNLLKLTNIRINFTELHTLGDLVLDPTKPEARLKYYYAVYDLVIRGSCSCYGHAEQCLPLPRQPNIAGMVHGQCDCTHNTEGKNCEKCKAGYNDRPWKPATADDPNECRRCDCNGHATECRFDPAVYAASGNISGGVCINCQHNTTGRKCEKCKPLHYQDPDKFFREPDSCIPCNCDSIGGVSGGECEGKDDPEAGLETGRCICKANVEGQRCNRCKKGFWNLQRSNPDGCEACSCSSAGTIDACDPQSGKCTCKRFVMGARCDRCQPGYWGLLESSSGCRPCDCDVGGSYERNCEQIKGQCRCRKGISGRKCDTVQTGNFFPLVDHLTYESEEARVIGEGEVAPREPPQREFVTWTGDGFAEVKDNAALEYAVTNVPYTGEYNILVRYEPKDSGIWQVNVKIERLDGLPLLSGKCINATNSKDPNYGNFSAILSTPRRYVLMLPSVCMEKDVSYVVKVTYSRHQSNTGVDTILTDSMVLLPSAESVSIFQGPDGEQRRKQFDRFRCLDYHLSATRPRPRLSDVCKQLIFAMSSVIYDGGQPCNCDPSGTKRDVNGTLICDAAGGQCECKPNVIGQRCDRCAPGSYGFGPQGCSACNCDSIGSSDNLCNIQTGQCSCRIQAWGRQCNLCPPSNWGFPLCRPCRCNNHASSCHPRTGECIDCQHNTAGNNCEVCSIGYYGDATVGTPNDCRRCQCPGGSSGNQFSKTCFLDRLTTPPSSYCDACDVGYTGRQCEQCDDGYYGNPLVPGGRCQPCSCNDNIDPFTVGNCDRLTGRCLACLYNTAGFSCERCKQGYYGDALVRNCTQCVCDARGTDPGFLDTCNYVTGQCSCLPNVIGTQCDTCADGFWNLASGKGCEKCDCCGEGSTQATCNELGGQCKCKPGYGGARCCECEDGYWGKPLGDCKPCNCNPAGSQTTQCDRVTGKCQCKPGMVGDKCDQCDVDTSGKMPQCEVCGECYYQWKVTLAYLSRNVSVEIGRALNLSLTPGPGNINAYSTELTELEEKLKQVEVILKSQVTTENDTKAIEEELDAINSQLQDIQKKVDVIDKEINSTFVRTTEANTEIRELRERLRNLLRKGQKLKSDAEKILGSDIRGAYEQVLKNQMRSREAEKKVDGAENMTKMSEEQRGKVQDLVEGPPSFSDIDTKNSNSLFDILEKIQELQEEAQELNGIVCGFPPSKCGGCGSMNCMICGGPGCNGSVELGARALMRAKEAEEAQRRREAKAKEKLQEVHDAEVMVNMTRQAAEEAVMRAMEADNRAKNASARMDQLIQDILDFLKQGYGDPEEIRRIAAMVTDLRLSVTPEEIEKLAKDIKDALTSLTGIDDILDATEGNLKTANDLLERAKQARTKAQAVSEVIKNVTDALATAAKSQKAAAAAIERTEDDIKMAEEILKGLLPGLDALEEAVDIARSNVTDMEAMVPVVKEQFEENKKQMEIAEENTRNAHNQSEVAMDEAEELQALFDQAKDKIEEKVESVQEASSKVLDLQEMGSDLVRKLANKRERILVIEKETITFEDLIEQVKALQVETKDLLDKISKRYICYRSCNPNVISPTCN